MLINSGRRRKAATAAVAIGTAVVLFGRWNGFTLPEYTREHLSGRIITSGTSRGEAKLVALTFDDGPDPNYTPRILAILKHYGIHGTFFVQGRMIRRYPDIVRNTVASGNTLGNHTDTHPYVERLDEKAASLEISNCDAVIGKESGLATRLFRPPRGHWTPSVFRAAEANGKTMVLWTTALEHESTPKPDQMVDYVLKHMRPGGIILMHDGANVNRETTVTALPILIQRLRSEGYRFVTVQEMLHMPAMELRPGAHPLKSTMNSPG